LLSVPVQDKNEVNCRTKRKPFFYMKTMFLVLPVLVFAPLAASGQAAPGRNQRVNSTAPGANFSAGAEHAAVSVTPLAAGAYNQGNSRSALRQQARTRRGAEYVAVSIAPRR